MTNDTTLYRAYIIRCPRGLDGSASSYLLINSGALNCRAYTDPERLLGALEQELATICPERQKRSLYKMGRGLRDFVKHFGW